MNRKVMFCWFWTFLLLLAVVATDTLAQEGTRQKEQGGMGRSLVGLQDGAQKVVVGFFGIGKHAVKFLYYGVRDGLHNLGRGAKKADSKIQKNLW